MIDKHWAAPYVKVAQNYGAVDKEITAQKLDEPISSFIYLSPIIW